MAALTSTTRTTVTVTCQACGTRHRIPMQIRTLACTRGELHVRVTTAPTDEVWARLFTEAHAGPFRYSRPRPPRRAPRS